MLITRAQLKGSMPPAKESNITLYLEPLNHACEHFEINTAKRLSSFLGQLAHESGCLRYNKEIASGEAYDTGKLAANLGNTPEKDGDGQKFKGRGPIQITGKANYKLAGKALGLDLVSTPDLLEDPRYGALSSAWFWSYRNLNYFADRDDYKTITKRINGGYNGYAQRVAYWHLARKVYGLPEIIPTVL